MKVYVASSWRNTRQPGVVVALRGEGHDVYDFRRPLSAAGVIATGFHWSDIDPAWQDWSPARFREALNHPIAKEGRDLDAEALHTADATVLVMPCGRSAHLELGYAIGRRQRTAILLSDGEPELMYGLADRICLSLDEVVEWLAGFKREAEIARVGP